LLCNIYLHELDKFIEGMLLPKWNRERTDKRSEEWNEASQVTGEQWLPSIRPCVIGPLVSRTAIRLALNRVMKMDRVTRNIPFYAIDPNHRKLHYVRYADDFLLGFVGPKKDAWTVLQEMAAFLEMDLQCRNKREVRNPASRRGNPLPWQLTGQIRREIPIPPRPPKKNPLLRGQMISPVTQTDQKRRRFGVPYGCKERQ
jgi:hypothetical protein